MRSRRCDAFLYCLAASIRGLDHDPLPSKKKGRDMFEHLEGINVSTYLKQIVAAVVDGAIQLYVRGRSTGEASHVENRRTYIVACILRNEVMAETANLAVVAALDLQPAPRRHLEVSDRALIGTRRRNSVIPSAFMCVFRKPQVVLECRTAIPRNGNCMHARIY